MPSGAKKRKAAKRKKEMAIQNQPPASPTNPNPNPPPPLSLHHQGNGRDGGTLTSLEKHPLTEEEAEEKFETPKSQADSVDIPMESLRHGIEEVKEEFHPSRDGDVSVEFVQSEKRDEGLKQTKLEESAEKNVILIEQSVLVTENPKTLVESVDTSSQEREVNGLPRPDEGITSKDGVVSFEFVQSGKRDDGGGSLEGGIRINEDLKETELDKSSEKSVISEEQSELVIENPKTLVVEVDASSHEREVKVPPLVDEGLKEINLDSAVDNLIPTEQSVPVTEEVIRSSELPAENNKDLVEAVDTSSSHEREVKVLTRPDDEIASEDGAVSVEFVQAEKGDDDGGDRSLEGGNEIDEGSKDMKLEKSGEENFVTIEQPVPVTVEVSQGSEVSAENFKALVDAVDTSSSHEREVKVLPQHDETRQPSLDATRTEILPRSEVACAPLVVHRASLWNCCGLLDVLTGSQR